MKTDEANSRSTTRPLTATMLEMGTVRIEPTGSKNVTAVERGVVIQFSTVEDFKLAISGLRPVRLEWPT